LLTKPIIDDEHANTKEYFPHQTVGPSGSFSAIGGKSVAEKFPGRGGQRKKY